jgi:hypothetical protein
MPGSAITATICLYTLDGDFRAIESFEGMASRAAQRGLIDVETRALIALVHPLSWINSERSLELIRSVLALSERQTDPLLQARSRMECYFYRILTRGGDAQDTEQCRKMLGEIQRMGNAATGSYYLAKYGCLQWMSAKYREAHQNLSVAISAYFASNDTDHLNKCH